MSESAVDKMVVHKPSKRIGIGTQEAPLGVYVRFPDGNEDFFPYEERRRLERLDRDGDVRKVSLQITFPGVTNLRGSTLTDVVLDVLRASYRHGGRRFLILDSHMANTGAVRESVYLFLDAAPEPRVWRLAWPCTRHRTQCVMISSAMTALPAGRAISSCRRRTR